MHVCTFYLNDCLGKPKEQSVKVKLPVVPRIGDYVHVTKIGGNFDTISGTVKVVEMYFSVPHENAEQESDTIPEAEHLIWQITVEEKGQP